MYIQYNRKECNTSYTMKKETRSDPSLLGSNSGISCYQPKYSTINDSNDTISLDHRLCILFIVFLCCLCIVATFL